MDGFTFDFSKDRPRMGEPIPKDTKLLVRMSYTPGGADFPDAPTAQRTGALTKGKDGETLYLKAEFTVLRGPYKGRKIFENMTVFGGKVDEKGRSIAAGITRGNLASILRSARGISSKDDSPEAMGKLVIAGFADFQGLVFVVKVGFEKGKDGYADKNRLGVVLTIDHKDYPKSEAELDAVAVQAAAPALPAAPAPAWGVAQNALPASQGAAPAPTFVAGVPQAQPMVKTASFIQAPTPTAAPAAALSEVAPAPVVSAPTVASSGLPAWARPSA